MKNKGVIPINKNILLIVAVLLLIYFGITFGWFAGNVVFAPTFFSDTDNIKYQHAGEVPMVSVGAVCQPANPDIEFSNEKIINTDKSRFKFVVSEVHQLIGTYKYRPDNPNVPRPTSIVSFKVEVYKDGRLIDTLPSIPSSYITYLTTPIPANQVYYRAYSDSGVVYIPEGESTPRLDASTPKQIKLSSSETGLNVVLGYKTILFNSPNCRAWKYTSVINQFEIVNVAPIGEPPIIEEPPITEPPITPPVVQERTFIERIGDFISNILNSIFGWFRK